MSENPGHSVILGNLEAIDQGLRLLEILSDEHYVHVAAPYVKSSIAQHFRHVVDMFKAVSEHQAERLIDYDLRRRGALIERCRDTAKAELLEIRQWMLTTLQHHDAATISLTDAVKVCTEVSTKETHSVHLESNLLRELVFASSHAVHHYALISVIAKLQGIVLEDALGVAPATATFLRNEAKVELDQTACAQ